MSISSKIGKVILGVACSDAHVVANHLIAFLLRQNGFDVINLGACTSVREFSEAARAHPDAMAMLIGSHNGHAREDLRGLKEERESGAIHCPVIVGGNLSVGSEKRASDLKDLIDNGVSLILSSIEEIIPTLRAMAMPQPQRIAL